VLVQAAPSSALRARLVLGKARALIRKDDWAEASVALAEAVRLAETAGDEAYETLMISLVMLLAVLGVMGRAEDAERIARRAVALSQERGDQLHLIRGRGQPPHGPDIARHEVAGAIEDQQTVMRIGRELGMLVTEYVGEYEIATLLYQDGDLEAAAQHARRAMAIEDRHPDVVRSAPVATVVLARVHAYAGEVEEARNMLRRIESAVQAALAEGQASGALTPSQEVLVSMVDLATRESTTAEWQALLERSGRDSIEQEPIEVADLYGTWALRRGRIEEARRAFEEASARASRIPNVMEARVRKGLLATAPRTT